MIDLRHPLAVLSKRLPWDEIEASLSPLFLHKDRAGKRNEEADLFGDEELVERWSENVVVDTTVQEKAIAYPVDSRLLEIARHKVVHAAKRVGISLK